MASEQLRTPAGNFDGRRPHWKVPTAALDKPVDPQIGLGSLSKQELLERYLNRPSNPPETVLKALGATNVTGIHTFDRTIADTDRFVEPLTRAWATSISASASGQTM